MFIASSISDDYLASNPTHHLGSVLLWVFRRVLLLFAQIFSQGRVSLLFTVILMGIAYTFTDSSNLKWRTHLAWSMLHALCQISSALICILFVEFMAEFVVSEGLVATAGNNDGVTTTQSCGTGLANTIYDEYTIHFSHTLEDFQLLNTTNSTDRPPDRVVIASEGEIVFLPKGTVHVISCISDTPGVRLACGSKEMAHIYV